MRLATFNRKLHVYGYCTMRAEWQQYGQIVATFVVTVRATFV